AVAFAAGAVLFNGQGALLDSNFKETPFANLNLGPELTGMAWAPDGSGRLFVTTKTGPVLIVKNGVVLPTPFVTVSPVFTDVECGVIGICFDQNYAVNKYVYLFVTVTNSEQQIIRYTVVGDAAADKTVLVS